MSAATTTSHTPWPTVKLLDVCDVIYGFPFQSNLFNTEGKGLPLVRIRNVLLGETETYTTESYGEEYLINTGDLLIGMDGDFNLARWKSRTALLNQRVCKLVARANVLSSYLCYVLGKSLKEIWEHKSFTTVKHLSAKDIKSISIPLPPLDVQREIVAKVEAGLKEADGLVAHFKRLAALADDTFKAELDETFSTLKEAPKVKLGDLGRVAMCKRIMKFQTTTTGDVPFYKIGTFGKSPNAYISKSLFQEFKGKFSYPEKGDVLISAAGTIGRSVIFDGAPAYFQDSNIVWLEHNRSRLMNEYLNYFYQTKPWKISEGVTIQRLYNGDIESISIPLPSLDIQREIVGKLEVVKVRCKRLKGWAERGLKAAEALRKAVLAEAFEQ